MYKDTMEQFLEHNPQSSSSTMNIDFIYNLDKRIGMIEHDFKYITSFLSKIEMQIDALNNSIIEIRKVIDEKHGEIVMKKRIFLSLYSVMMVLIGFGCHHLFFKIFIT